MGCLLITVFALLACGIWATWASLVRRRSGPGWWAAMGVASLVGLVIGLLGSLVEYRVSPTLRVTGFPFRVAIFQWEGPPGQEEWIDYISAFPLLPIGGNCLVGALFAAALVCGAYWLFRGLAAWGA